jgi:hypothetical protein
MTLGGGRDIGIIERLLFRALTSGEGPGEVLGLWCHVFEGFGPVVRVGSSDVVAGAVAVAVAIAVRVVAAFMVVSAGTIRAVVGEIESVGGGVVSFNLWVIRPAGCGTSIMVRSFGRSSDSEELCKGARSFSDGGEVVSMLG